MGTELFFVFFGWTLEASVPFRWHKELDIAVVTLPTERRDRRFPPLEDEVPMLIDPRSGVTPGKRIAWAGYPGAVEDFLKHPQLCYFEGSVSAMVDRDDKELYIADGYVAYGVSGGPVWHWSEETNRSEVAGIVTSYAHANDELPEFCVFEPVNPLSYYLKNWHVSLPGGYDNFVELRVGSKQTNAA